MSFEDDLHRIDQHVAEARRLVQQQKGLITRLRAGGVNAWDAQKNAFAAGIEPSATWGTQRPPQTKRAAVMNSGPPDASVEPRAEWTER